MHEEFRDRGDPLGRLIEECGEVLAAAGKSVRFGFDSTDPLSGDPETNLEWLLRELADLKDAVAQFEGRYRR